MAPKNPRENQPLARIEKGDGTVFRKKEIIALQREMERYTRSENFFI